MKRWFIILFALLSSALSAQQAGFLDLYLRAVSEFSDKQYESALQKFAILHESNPEDDAVSYYLGMCQAMTGDTKAGEENLLAAYRRDTTNEWYVSALVNYYNITGDRALFANYAVKLMEMNPGMYSNPYMLSLVGDTRLSQRRNSEALSYYSKALDLDPSYIPAELGRMEAYRMSGNNAAFFSALDKIVSNPDVRAEIKSDYLEALLQNMSASFYWVWGTKLAALVDKCLELHPLDVKSNLLKINLLTIEGEDEAALAQCGLLAQAASAAGDKENLALAYNLEGDIAHSLGDMNRTYSAYDKALEVNPDLPAVLNNYAYFLALEKRSMRKALKMSRRAVELEPDNVNSLDTLGWILYLMGKPEEAKTHFKRAMIYGGKDSAVVLEHYSKVLEALGETNLANYYLNLSKQKSE